MPDDQGDADEPFDSSGRADLGTTVPFVRGKSILLTVVALTSVGAGCGEERLPPGVAAPTSTSTTPTSTTSTTTSRVLPVDVADVAGPSIPAWNGHDAAISWTFDDAFASHLDRVVPSLDALGRPATFSPTCSLVLADVERWRAASERHEIANHTMTHAVAGPDTDPAEITECHDLLVEEIGVESRTFA